MAKQDLTPISNVLHWLSLGGPVMLVLAALSVAALTIIIVKIWEFRDLRLDRDDFVKPALAFWRKGDVSEALSRLDGHPGPLAEVMAAAMRLCADTELNDVERREMIEAVAQEKLESLRGLFRPLELIGSLSPLLGLLGTVLGMIEAFSSLEAAGSAADAGTLSGGIAQALLTTAAGLMIAVPAVAMLSWLERRVERTQSNMESALTRILVRHWTGDRDDRVIKG